MWALIIAGFATLTIGVALLILGEVPIGGGKRIPALRSRLIGVILLSLLPLTLVAQYLAHWIFDPDNVPGLAVSWSIFGVCWIAAFVVLFRVLVPKRAPRGVKASEAASSANAAPGFVDAVEAEPPPKQAAATLAKKPPAKKAAKPAPREENPFDFS